MTDGQLSLVLLLWFVSSVVYYELNTTASDYTAQALSATMSSTDTGTAAATPTALDGFVFTMVTAQLSVGAAFALLLWLVRYRPAPSIEAEDIIRSLPAGLCCGGSHLATLASIAGGGLAFSQIVKAAEPVFSGCVGTVFYGTRLPAKNWLCFVPICGGILLASLKLSDSAVVAAAGASAASTTTGMPIPAALDAFLFNARIALSALYSPASIELDFSVASLVAAVLANTFAAFKGPEMRKLLLTSQQMQSGTDKIKQRMGGARNQYAVTYIIGWLACVPVMLYAEKRTLVKFWSFFLSRSTFGESISLAARAKQILGCLDTVTAGASASAGAVLFPFLQRLESLPFPSPMTLVVTSAGLALYLSDEWAVLTLKKISATTLSVLNTAKRVVIISWGVWYHGRTFDPLKQLGCAMTLIGVVLNTYLESSGSGGGAGDKEQNVKFKAD